MCPGHVSQPCVYYLLGQGCEVAQLPVSDVNGHAQAHNQWQCVGCGDQDDCAKEGSREGLGRVGNLPCQGAHRVPVVQIPAHSWFWFVTFLCLFMPMKRFSIVLLSFFLPTQLLLCCTLLCFVLPTRPLFECTFWYLFLRT